MSKQKGFTLVELLAVIVILAIIALIATPIILNVIEEAKKGAAKASALGYLDAVEKQMAINLLDSDKSNDIIDGTYVEADLTAKGVSVKGDKPTSVSITIKNGQINDYTIIVDGYKVNYDNGNIKVEKDDETGKDEDNQPEEVAYKCKRATTLHTEECTQTDSTYYCSGAGYTGTTITYGNDPSTRTTGTLTSGDAFDCDVNGDGTYDAATERFYYVSDLYDTTSNTYNSDYAVLIYYNNTAVGAANNTSSSRVAYDSSDENWHGPVTAITKLPTITQWSNVSLSSATRQIRRENGGTTTSGGTLPTTFSYEGYAARLLTTQELEKACEFTVGSSNDGELDKCNYLMENTQYASSSMGTYGYWLETSSFNYVWNVTGDFRGVSSASANYKSSFGTRPTIEVLKSNISY